MALILKWTENALDDILSIAEFISRDSEFYGKTVVKKLIDIINIIPESPELGRIVPEIEDPNI